MTEMVGELPPGQQLVEKLFGAGTALLQGLARNPERGYAAVMQVRRHAADPVRQGRVVAQAMVLPETVGQEIRPAPVAGVRSARGARHGRQRVVDPAAGDRLIEGAREIEGLETGIALERGRPRLGGRPHSGRPLALLRFVSLAEQVGPGRTLV
jgi:hypothetical protein